MDGSIMGRRMDMVCMSPLLRGMKESGRIIVSMVKESIRIFRLANSMKDLSARIILMEREN